jgi:hypothetical protein
MHTRQGVFPASDSSRTGDKMADAPKPKSVKMPPVEMPPDLAVEYANMVRIAHTPSELVFDFAHLIPGGTPAQVSSRIIMSPLAAKLFQRALAENLAKYETAFGKINIPGDSSLASQLFRPGPPTMPPPDSEPQ